MNSQREISRILPPGTPEKKLDLLTQITQYVDRNLSRKVTLREVAAHFGVSISTITQLFQRNAHTTFHNYLTQRRMATAKQLIDQGTALESTGRMVGYSDHSTFYRAFCKHFRVSPREYRRQMLLQRAAETE